MEATHSTHQYLKKLAGDFSHTVSVLGGAFQQQQKMETVVVVRKSVDAHHQSAAESTASLGPADQPTLKERSLTMNAERPSFHSILKVLQYKNNKKLACPIIYICEYRHSNNIIVHDCVSILITTNSLNWGEG